MEYGLLVALIGATLCLGVGIAVKTMFADVVDCLIAEVQGDTSPACKDGPHGGSGSTDSGGGTSPDTGGGTTTPTATVTPTPTPTACPSDSAGASGTPTPCPTPTPTPSSSG